MADIHPFRALRYNPKKVENLGTVIAPPFDLIDYAQRQELLAQDPYNVVNLVLGDVSTFPPEIQAKDLHTESAHTLENWKREKILIQDDTPAIYMSEDHFSMGGKKLVRKGLFMTVTIEPLGQGQILPHERTLKGPIQDRLSLLGQTRTHLSPTFMTFHDDKKRFMTLLNDLSDLDPFAQCTNPNTGIEHRLHRICSPELIQSIQSFLKPHSLLIADGHHRYTTAHEFSTQHPELPEAQRMMIHLVSSADPGLILSAIHRVVNSQLTQSEIIKRLEGVAKVERTKPSWSAFESAKAPLAWIHQDVMYLITPHEKNRDLLTNTPANLFNEIVLEKAFGIDPMADDFTRQVELLHDPQEVNQHAQSNQAHGFWLKPMLIPEVIEIAKQGHRLPQKATFFYPKVMSGLLFHSLG